jgi:hypothetical protein
MASKLGKITGQVDSAQCAINWRYKADRFTRFVKTFNKE